MTSSKTAPSTALPPLVRTVLVPWDVPTSFRRFTEQFGSWWPIRTHSVGGTKTRTAIFEGRVGGEIHEVFHDGGRSVWGTVLVWEPTRRVVFTWHPSRGPETSGEVEVRFEPEGSGTRLTLVHSQWERLGKRARTARRAYGLGWRYVLDTWAGRRTGTVRVLDAITALAKFFKR